MSPAPTAGPLRWLLATNIVSEPARQQPDARVLEALLTYRDELALPAIVLQELHFGWLCLPEGRQRRHIGAYLHGVVSHIPVLALDAAAARLQANLRWQAQQAGRPMPYADSEIAAIAVANGLTLVTRNTRDFEGRAGLQVANWFEA